MGFSVNDRTLEQTRDTTIGKSMWETNMSISELHILVNRFHAQRYFCTITIDHGEKVLFRTNCVRHLASLLKSMIVESDNSELFIAISNELREFFYHITTILDTFSDEDLSLDVVKRRLQSKSK